MSDESSGAYKEEKSLYELGNEIDRPFLELRKIHFSAFYDYAKLIILNLLTYNITACASIPVFINFNKNIISKQESVFFIATSGLFFILGAIFAIAICISVVGYAEKAIGMTYLEVNRQIHQATKNKEIIKLIEKEIQENKKYQENVKNKIYLFGTLSIILGFIGVLFLYQAISSANS